MLLFVPLGGQCDLETESFISTNLSNTIGKIQSMQSCVIVCGSLKVQGTTSDA